MNNFNSLWLNHFVAHLKNDNNEISVIGAKAEGLKTLTGLGISTPSGFIINNKLAKQYFATTLPADFVQDLTRAVQWLESVTDCRFGDVERPLFVSVRSSPCKSAPGLLPTILNIGICGKFLNTDLSNAPGFMDNFGNWLRAFYTMTHPEEKVTWPKEWSRHAIQTILQNHCVQDCAWWNDPLLQIQLAVGYILDKFRHYAAQDNTLTSLSLNEAPGIIVQKMIWGNTHNKYSGTGVVFSRNPQNGKREIFGDFAVSTVGAKLVAGDCEIMPLWSTDDQILTMQKLMPDLFAELVRICHVLETHYGYLQDIEFTVDNSKLWILQTRNARVTSQANLRFALDALQENKGSIHKIMQRLSEQDIVQNFQSQCAHYSSQDVVGHGDTLVDGVVSGLICFDDRDIQHCAASSQNVIWLNKKSKNIDFNILSHAKGLLTVHGASTSHLAVMARGMAVPFVSGLDMDINYEKRTCVMRLSADSAVKTTILRAGDLITVDGARGNVVSGNRATSNYGQNQDLNCFLEHISRGSNVEIMANINFVSELDLIKNSNIAGVGLCRTEHLLHKDDLLYLRAYYLSDREAVRQDCLAKLSRSYEKYFDALLSSMADAPVTIRLFDMPLYEFLPETPAQIQQVSDYCQDEQQVKIRLKQARYDGGMLGLRGIRFGIVYPDFYGMQIRAIMNSSRKFARARVGILLPFVSFVQELSVIKKLIHSIYDEFDSRAQKPMIGTMLETPSALMLAAKLAEMADFFSFGTNDLSQLMFGICRENNNFIKSYHDQGILFDDPFLNINHPSILSIMTTACQRARKANPHIKIGICGEGTMSQECMKFVFDQGINYISCPVKQIPILQFRLGCAHLTHQNHDR